jgi:hypothetical protein
MKKLSNESSAQRLRLLKRLQERPCSTIDARHELDILAVAPRIYELRHWYGYNILTFYTTADNPGGCTHKVANYVLLPGQYKEMKHAI